MTAAAVFWFTGLSGAGKSTIACALKSRLELKGVSVLILDGDYVRKHLHKHLGFSDSDIKQNNLLIAKLCINNRNKYEVILVPIISPFKSSRQLARNMLGNKFYEVYLSVDLDTVVERDVKGLYAKAIDGEIDKGHPKLVTIGLQHAKEKGFDPKMHLIWHDAWTAFNAVDELFSPGPTGTNVNDFRAMLLR